ncbi:MAG: phosphatase PAP2 family protein, partial [Rhodanobacter sp.]
QWPLMLALGLTGWQLLRHRDGVGAWRLLGAWLVAWAIEALISHYAFHPRPFAAGFGPALLAHAANNSMPSSHATIGLLLVLTLAMGRQVRMCAAVGALTLAVMWARVYVGIHWPADMLGALLIALLSMGLAYAIQRTLLTVRQRRRRGAAIV